MKILIVSTAYLPLIGGAELAVKEITDRLPDHKFNLVCARISKSLPATEKVGRVQVRRVGIGSTIDKYLLPFAVFIEGLFGRYDLVWAVMASYGSFALPFVKLLRPRLRFLLTLQEGDSEEHILRRVGIFYPFWRMVFRSADYVQAISTYLADFARRHGAKCPVEVVPNGVDIRGIKNQELGIGVGKQNRFTAISVSRLVPKNGIDVLIRAAKELKSIIPNSLFLIRIVGGGQNEQKLRQLSKELGVEDLVEFVGEVPSEEVPQYLAKADIFVRPSRSEGLGTAFLEAMAAGLPIVGTPVGGIPDFLKDPSTSSGQVATGLFTKVNDPADLAQKIKLLLTDNQLRNQLAQNGKKLVTEQYSWDKISQEMNRIFQLQTINYSLRTILVATGLYPPEIGGPATHTVLMERELPKRGMDIKVLAFRDIRWLPSGIRHLAYFIKCLGKYDLIFAQDTVSVGFPAAIASALTGRPFVVRVPGDWVWEQAAQRWGVKEGIDKFQHRRYSFRVELFRAIQRFTVNRADLVITPSDYFNRLVSGWVRNPNKVKTIYNGIELVNPIPKTLNPIPRTIVSVGRLVPWKGFNTLIEIMKDLPEWRLVIVGDGPEDEKLRVMSRELLLSDRVEFTGAVSREELFERLRSADIFVLNSSFESFSFQTVEAMSVGLPVIVTNIGSLPEIVEDGKSGILVEPNNKEQFIKAIKRIEADSDFYKDLSKAAQERAKRFSVEKTTSELAHALTNL